MMSIDKMKRKVVETIDHFSEEKLAQALDLLKILDSKEQYSLNNQAHLDRHFARYDDVLKKLAQ